jgi:DNA-binding transcriptional MerR regulator
MMPAETFKVGELARRTGLSIRTLHHYDEIGLLRPSLYTESGHRLYTAGDVARLQQVLSLRQLGFSLDEIRDCLSGSEYSPLEVVRMHLDRLRQQIELQQGLCERLESLAAHFERAEEVSAATFLQTIEVMNMIENYYTPEQLETLKQRREQVGPERMQQAPNDWSDLFAAFRAEMERGTDPADPRVQALEQRRKALVNEFTGGDAGIEQSLKRLWTEQGDKLAAQYGYKHDPQLADYMEQAGQAANRPS